MTDEHLSEQAVLVLGLPESLSQSIGKASLSANLIPVVSPLDA